MHHVEFIDGSYERLCNTWGAAIRTRYMRDFELDHCEFSFTKGSAYGYKAEGHERAKIHDNNFRGNSSLGPNDGRGFSMEAAHEFEYDLEIYNNEFSAMVSVPRQGNNSLTSHATGTTYEYSVRIHDNLFHGSGGVEGPRMHLEIDHNYFANTWGNNGRVFEIHGGQNPGPTKIHHNVAECSMGFVFKKNELNENISITNNTVYLVNTTRNGFPTSFLEVSGAVSNWEVRNNIVFSVDPVGSESRSGFSRSGLPASGITFSNNLAWKVNNIVSGVLEEAPELALAGSKPTAYFSPSSATSNVVDAGVDVGYAFEGAAPDIGAHEWMGAQPPTTTHTITGIGGCQRKHQPHWLGYRRRW